MYSFQQSNSWKVNLPKSGGITQKKEKEHYQKKGDEKMIAYCGMDCSKCEGYLATQENSDIKRQKVAEQWTAQYNTDIKPEQINCSGCKSDGVKFFFTESICEIREFCILFKFHGGTVFCPKRAFSFFD